MSEITGQEKMTTMKRRGEREVPKGRKGVSGGEG